MTKIHLLELNDDGTPCVGTALVRLPAPFEPYTLRFVLYSTNQLDSGATLKINVPAAGQVFDRQKFLTKSLKAEAGTDACVDVEIDQPGAFAWRIEYLNEDAAAITTAEYYIVVDPALTINGTQISLDALAIQSVVPKWMGKLTQWSTYLEYMSSVKKYNMLHFCPLQQRGASDSPYSLFDQHKFSDDLFDNVSLSLKDRTAQMEAMVNDMEHKYGLLSLTDVVWNHTASDSDWLQDHPEAGFNLHNSPHLCAAFALDTALLELSSNLSKLGLPTTLKSTQDLLAIMEAIKSRVLGTIKLWEFYVIDTQKALSTMVFTQQPAPVGELNSQSSLESIADFCLSQGVVQNHQFLGDRFSKIVDPAKLGAIINALCCAKTDKLAFASRILDEINLRFYQEHNADQDAFMEQLYNRIKYVRLDSHGPKMGPITSMAPLIETYFTRLPSNDRTRKHPSGSLALANNGWMWAANPLENFAGPQSKAYLRREVIVWGDCVKLRYGDCPADNPYLWEHMRLYTSQMASIFHGFRIDNCHSTPIPVARYLLDEARKSRPNLYVVAELFTGSEDMDTTFVQKLGICSLLREAMQAWSPDELSRLVHKYGPSPIGSIPNQLGNVDSSQLIKPAPIHALFFDCTHDNETPVQKRSAEDTLPNAALVAMTASAIGSVFGYDEVYPHILDLVSEKRHYSQRENGLGRAKGVLNAVHIEMGLKNYSEAHVHHEGAYITVHRVSPETKEGYFLIAHTAFHGGQELGAISPIRLSGTSLELVYAATLSVTPAQKDASEYTELDGVPASVVMLDFPVETTDDDDTILTVPGRFPPGSIALFRTKLRLPKLPESPELSWEKLEDFLMMGASEAVASCSLIDLNVLLYRCNAEEQDTVAEGAYNIPNYGQLVYAGLQGWMAPISAVTRSNDLGHPLCDHLRNGLWALDYIVAREQRYIRNGYDALSPSSRWLSTRFDYIKRLPNFLVPKAFVLVIKALYCAARERSLCLLSKQIRRGTKFTQDLALCSLQMQGAVKSASIDPAKSIPCMAAGLPHFSTSWARCWGRDIFIAMRGLLLVTERYAEAESHILAFATTLKHGMIPNLLDSLRTPRYNSRDSIWFYMQAIQDYVTMVPNGAEILKKSVKRRFPLNDEYVEWDDQRAYSYQTSVTDVIQETLARHAQGLHFREANAGPKLDMQMSNEGFNIDVEVDWSTGFLHGGNQHNCGTWMDKMGESERAGSKGVPGTPRDGAAVEITGLLKSTLRWVNQLHQQGLYPYTCVRATIDGKETDMTFVRWEALIQSNFERCYYIPKQSSDDAQYEVDAAIVNRRGIYKDLYKSGKAYEDYQLRAQVPMAMTVAPELFETEHALSHLETADHFLRGPLGMATLDPIDNNYRPYYNNTEDSTDFHTAKGRNYHQGPEWVFPVGYFLRAMLHFQIQDGRTNSDEISRQIYRRLSAHRTEIMSTPWTGLTELTNKAGALCGDSSPTQAWSSGTLLDVIHDMQELRVKQL
ncbi:glucanotransferase domain of glycogen debranching enzyme-domain-containing protein [Protomyces lactucae-debilis]|uniref:Glycogen debranching enzyme n=1 Tax=Protomyces lactucae-debilis TaxID=2754530 RepID=A0A1Y2FEV4_PROLT|nr:glucanotransferase domain of glycogen debranching enzyme-domain-containing protein [Protomyces lactucae-debilis]ORY82459.1 glucanotransferase domain of glycogen debranching enzyme-domain-containing protein [Protomyces lactucae-debilis]